MELTEQKKTITDALLDKNGQEITVLNVENLTVIADCFIIATAKSMPHVRALAENVDEKMSAAGEEPLRKEGIRDSRWAVLDYGAVIVHIFNDDTRVLYALEKLWTKGDNVERIN